MEDENNKITPPLVPTQPNTTLNENDTVYDLLPTIINKPPVIVQSISEASTPQVKPSSIATTVVGNFMYLFPDGNVKVHANTIVALKVVAKQPDTYNVENGELVVKEAQAELVYSWTKDGASIVANDEEPSLLSSRILKGNTLTFNNMIPRYAGTYNCTVSNDIGSSDGGTITIEVFNSDVDSSFYTNLVLNPNGTAEDGTLSVEGWQSTSGEIVAKQLSSTTNPTKHKKVEVDPFNPEFEWTSEMLYPKPYQIDGGSLRNNAIANLNSYLTRTDYSYIQNGGEGLFTAYQDIDLTDIQSHIQGAIYGIDGVRGVLSFYLGMAIYNYTPAFPYTSPEARSKASTYFLGAPRLSLENFIKAGPGFVKEVAYVEIEEYDKEERLQSKLLNKAPQTQPIKTLDPWNKRLPQYNNQVYYNGNQNYAVPDEPSMGDDRDRHLFTADELVPNIDDRFTYGQYAELNKIVLDKLNPRTNRLRIVISIEPGGILNSILREGGKRLFDGVGSGIFEASGEKTYKSLSVESNNSAEEDRQWIGEILRTFRTTEPINLRIPKASKSKAFASGFNLALIPLETGKEQQINREVDLLISQNTRVASSLPSVLTKGLSFDARDKGNRLLDISFEMNSSDTSINIVMLSSNADIPELDQVVLQYNAGLFPFRDKTTLVAAPRVLGAEDTKEIASINYSFNATNGVTSPIYMNPTSYIRVGTYKVDGYSINPEGEEIPVKYIDISNPNVQSQVDPGPLYIVPKLRTTNTLIVTQLYNTAGNTVALSKPDEQVRTPMFPQKWYSINDSDKLSIYNGGDNLSENYDKWSTPQNPITMEGWYQNWNTTGFSPVNEAGDEEVSNFYKKELQPQDYTWNGSSRFIITLGAHNTNMSPSSAESIHSTETYYLDFNGQNAVIHKTPNLGGAAYLPGFSKEEQYRNDTYTFLNTQTDNYESFVSSGIKTYIADFLKKQKMDPIVIPVQGGIVTTTATLNLPQTLLTGSRLQGGLNIPTIVLEDQSIVADPSYKIVLYGIRPATAGEFLKDSTTLDSNSVVGTPLAGEGDYGLEFQTITVGVDRLKYTVRTISVTNKINNNTPDTQAVQDTPIGDTPIAQ
jgi:hypothetical protein